MKPSPKKPVFVVVPLIALIASVSAIAVLVLICLDIGSALAEEEKARLVTQEILVAEEASRTSKAYAPENFSERASSREVPPARAESAVRTVAEKSRRNQEPREPRDRRDAARPVAEARAVADSRSGHAPGRGAENEGAETGARVRHLREAAEHLELAGFQGESAEFFSRAARLEQEHRDRILSAGVPFPAEQIERLHRQVEEMQGLMRRVRAEVEELRREVRGRR